MNSSGKNTYNIEVLKDDNYMNWTFRMQMILAENSVIQQVEKLIDVDSLNEEGKNKFYKNDNRAKYNPIFSKTTHGGSKALSGSKWLVRNNANNNLCPVRLFLKIIEKRESNPYLTTTRLFLTVHPNWEKGIWYKNSPLGIDTISKWNRQNQLV